MRVARLRVRTLTLRDWKAPPELVAAADAWFRAHNSDRTVMFFGRIFGTGGYWRATGPRPRGGDAP